MLARHQVDGGELLQVLEPLVTHELGLALVLVHTQARLGVHGEVGQQVGLLEVAELALGLLAEGRSAPLGRIADLGEDLVPRRLHLVDPLVAGGQDRLGGGEVRGRGPEVDHQFLKRFDLGKGLEPVPMGRHFRGVVAEVLELAGRGVGLQGFKEGLGLVQFGAQLLDFVLGQQAAAPEEQPGLQALLHEHQPLHSRE